MSHNMSSSEMKQTFKLPMVPGTSCGEELLRRSYHKSQVFGAKHEKAVRSEAVPIDYSATLGVSKSLYGTNGMPGSPSKSGGKLIPLSQSMSAPQQGAGAAPDLDRRVLRYFGFFREAVQESSVERERVRKVTINFFLEDGTLSVVEPRQDNSGIAFQGNMVKRHLVPKPDGSGPVTFDMLAVGGTVEFYGRVYYLTDADAFTREFMTSIGVEVPEAFEIPTDAHTTLRSRPAKVNDVPSITATTTSHVKLSSAQKKASKQFFEHDRNVLRLTAVWDDRKALYGELHRFSVYYFLADDTFEIVEKSGVNSGRDPFPSFIRRAKIFKPKPGVQRFENVTSSVSFKGKDEGQAIYTDADITIGATINFFGRNLLVVDYDQHTRDHLRLKYGITDYAPLTKEFEAPPKAKAERIPPPHTGFGTEEDSLTSWNRLEGKPPRKDMAKYNTFGGNVIKYSIRLDNGSAVDEVRRFVLTCYLADDTIAIFEPEQRNSGIVSGKFLQRQRVRNPATGKYFVGADFHVGCRTVINGFPFEVLATDERSLSYMEQHSSHFAHCNINAIAHKIQAMLLSSRSGLSEAFYRADTDGNGALDYKEMTSLVNQLGLDVSEQEILTVLRYFDRNGDAYISYAEFVSRLLPEGAEAASDSRDWHEIYEAMNNADHDRMDTKDKVAQQKAKVETTTAAYAARAFLEAYANRRTLFLQEFKFICDYSTDEKISEKEFRQCCVEKLRLPLTDVQLDALAAKLFPAGARRVTYDEFVRLINGNSNRDNHLKLLKEKR